MIDKRVWVEASAIFLGLGLLTAAQWFGTQQMMGDHESSLARRISRTVSPVLDHAHDFKDDLLLQQVVQATAQVPGISFTAIVDEENKILAHNEPAKLGQTLQSRVRPGVWSYSLGTSQSPWGHLKFGLSDVSFRQRAIHESLLYILFLSVLALALLALSLINQKKRQEQKIRLDDLEALLNEATAFGQELESKIQQVQVRNQAVLQMVLCHFTVPVLLLDARQRILAVSEKAAQRLNIIQGQAYGKSWQDIPTLTASGSTLEQSLASPGKAVDCLLGDRETVLRFKSAPHGLGTWISISTLNDKMNQTSKEDLCGDFY